MACVLFTVHFLDGRYHGLQPDGRSEWPPSPARLFQALVAGAGRGAGLAAEDKLALEWLERLDPPIIAAPARHKGQSVRHFVPNNEMDTVGGDPRRIGDIRSAKDFHPQIFDRDTPFLYVWTFDDVRDHAERLQDVALQLYQLGRGVDIAWAVAEVVDDEEVRTRLAAHPGAIYRPARNGGGQSLACPIPGSLRSLIDRYEKNRTRFKPVIEASPTRKDPSRKRIAGLIFTQPPKPKFGKVFYDSPPTRLLYELRDLARGAGFAPWPVREVVLLVELVRNEAAGRMKRALPEKTATIDRVFGLCRDATEADKARRIRIIPMPSIGHPHADRSIRRLLVEIPPDCPLPAKDIEWAFFAIDQETGEVQAMLVRTEQQDMLRHYGIGEYDQAGFRLWRTVTPMALPVARSHGRKKGSERAAIEEEAAGAVVQALRHAGITKKPVSIRVQREPFDAKGLRAEVFAPSTRFAAARLWHVEIAFAQPVPGPLVAGDGRYLGLGLMRPIKQPEGVYAFIVVSGLSDRADRKSVTLALRRAVMALVQEELGAGTVLPTFFTGHEADGSPARRGGRAHLAFALDGARKRLLVIAPHLLEGRPPAHEEREYLAVLDAALRNLRELRAGPAGLLKLEYSIVAEDGDPLFAPAKLWTTMTSYRPTRHDKKTRPEEAIVADVRLELRRRGFPLPASVEEIDVARGPRGGLSARLRLAFSTAVRGPLLLGRNCNLGSGLFVGSG